MMVPFIEVGFRVAALAARVGESITRLTVTRQEQTQAPEVLLMLLTDPGSRRDTSKLCMLVAELEPTAQHHARATKALLSPSLEWPLWIFPEAPLACGTGPHPGGTRAHARPC